MLSLEDLKNQLQTAFAGESATFEHSCEQLNIDYIPCGGVLPIDPKKQRIRAIIRVSRNEDYEDEEEFEGRLIITDESLYPPYEMVERFTTGSKPILLDKFTPADDEVVSRIKEVIVAAGNMVSLNIVVDPCYFIARLSPQPEPVFNDIVAHFFFHELYYGSKSLEYFEGVAFALATARQFNRNTVRQSIDRAILAREAAKELAQ